MRATAHESALALADLLADTTTEERRLIAGYLDAKKILARAFEVFGVERYRDPAVMTRVKTVLETEMRRTFDQLPERYLRVRGYGESQARILAYLARSIGSEVTADELRMLTGDAVHTERRARELRDLGLHLEARHTGGADVYVLRSLDPNASEGAAIQVSRNIRNDKQLSAESAARLLVEAGLPLRQRGRP
jgi:hypothetical protein